MKAITILSLMLFSNSHVASAAITVSFDELSGYNGNAVSGTGSYYNGNAASSGWTSQGAFFSNTYNVDPTYGDYWSGWSYSNVNNTTTASFTNQYASSTGSGVAGSGNYAIAYEDLFANDHGPYFNLPANQRIDSLSISNTTYTGFTMREGNQFSEKFGGLSGNEPDFFKVTFHGFSGLGATGSSTGSTEFYLADYRNSNNSLDYIVSDWRLVDLSGLGDARSVKLSFDGSDKGDFGFNTPTYAAIDNITLVSVPEPTGIAFISCAFIALTLRRSRTTHKSPQKS